MSSNVDEARQVIEQMRAKRAALGDHTDTTRRIRYKRLTRPKIASVVFFGYVFVSGMLFSAVLQGYKAAFICFVLVVVVMMYSYLKE